MFPKHLIANHETPAHLAAPLGYETPYEYHFTGEGVMLRAERKELSLFLPLAECQVRLLPRLPPVFDLRTARVPESLVTEIFMHALSARDPSGRLVESLFHLLWHEEAGEWELVIPEQIRTRTSVHPVDDGAGSSYQRAIIEVHSHHELDYGPNFSETDDEEEKLFRIYAVIGDFKQERPRMRTRIGVFQQFIEIPSNWVFNLPAKVGDCVAEEIEYLARRARSGRRETDEREA